MLFVSRFTILGGLLLAITACDRPAITEDRRTSEEKTGQTAHRVGEDAYKATQKAKEATKSAVREVKKASREFRDGWEDAKHRDPEPPRSSKGRINPARLR